MSEDKESEVTQSIHILPKKKKKTRAQVIKDNVSLARIAYERAALLSAVHGRCDIALNGLEKLVLPRKITEALQDIMSVTAPFYMEPEKKEEPPTEHTEGGLVILK